MQTEEEARAPSPASVLVRRLRAVWLAALAGPIAAQAQASTRPVDDGWFDVSSFLKEKYGFLPIVAPITEPAVGYGVAGGLAFLDEPLGEAKAGFGRPDITFLGGMATENDSAAGALGDIRYWLDDRVQTRVFVVDGSLNLDFYGLGDAADATEPLRYNLEPLGTSLDVRYRLGDSSWWVGLNYSLARIDVSFEAPGGAGGLPGASGESEIGGFVPSLSFDSRDNMFTPNAGSYLEATLGLFDDSLGGDADFQRPYLIGMHYLGVAPQLWLGLRGDLAGSFGDVPFYLRPFVPLRGVPMLRYQGEAIASFEAELRWQFWERISLVGFGGLGAAWNDFERFDDTTTVATGGVGLRYELAREFGLHAGFDVAWGPEDTVLYIQFGSAWIRP